MIPLRKKLISQNLQNNFDPESEIVKEAKKEIEIINEKLNENQLTE